MASNEKWDTISRVLGPDRRKAERPRPITTAAQPAATPRQAAGRGEQGRRPRRDHDLEEIRAQRGLADLTKDDGTEGARAFQRISARMAERLALSSEDDAYEFRGGEFVLTRGFRARRAKLAPATRPMQAPRPLTRPGTGRQAPRTIKTPRRPSAEEIARLRKEYDRHDFPALHEAGHSVVAYHLGLDVTSASLVGRHEGITDVRFIRSDERWLTVLYAGIRGEQLHERWEDGFETLWALQEDYRLIEEQIASLELWPKDELALRERVIAQVDEILERYADDHYNLARALTRERTVSGKRLRDLLGEES